MKRQIFEGLSTSNVNTTQSVLSVFPTATTMPSARSAVVLTTTVPLIGAHSAMIEATFTMTVSYPESAWQRAGVADESQLNLYLFNELTQQWEALLPCPGCLHDQQANRFVVVIKSCQNQCHSTHPVLRLAETKTILRVNYSTFLNSYHHNRHIIMLFSIASKGKQFLFKVF
ncbi:hypothetical protein QUF64_12390 [Anaerolineales bacterium HSG6]|nr:hypothetical protein [Anaerolineales bacterium HSG6]